MKLHCCASYLDLHDGMLIYVLLEQISNHPWEADVVGAAHVGVHVEDELLGREACGGAEQHRDTGRTRFGGGSRRRVDAHVEEGHGHGERASGAGVEVVDNDKELRRENKVATRKRGKAKPRETASARKKREEQERLDAEEAADYQRVWDLGLAYTTLLPLLLSDLD